MELEQLQKRIKDLENIIIGAGFLVKKLCFDKDLSLGMEEQIKQFQEDALPIITRRIKENEK